MEIRELRSFLALVDEGSLVRAAERMNLSAPAIHKQIRLMEGELGAALYEREGRRIRLTQMAQFLIPHARRLLADYASLVQALDEWRGLKRGMVRIGSGPTFSTYLLPSLLATFRQHYPEVEIFAEAGHTPQLLTDVRKGSIDLALLVDSPLCDPSEFRLETILEFEMVLVTCSKEPPRRCRLAQLEKFPFILYAKGSVLEDMIDRYFAANGFRPSVSMRFDNAESIKAMLHSRFGISMLPAWTVEAEIGKGSISLIRQKEPPLTGRQILVTRNLNFLPAPVRAFIEISRNRKWHVEALPGGGGFPCVELTRNPNRHRGRHRIRYRRP